MFLIFIPTSHNDGDTFYKFSVTHKNREPNRHLLVHSQQWKHHNNVRNLFKVNNKDTGTTSLTTSLTSL